MFPETPALPLWMWAWLGLPSILASLKSQQTLPVVVFSVTSTLPLLDPGAAGFSLVPFNATSNLTVLAVAAFAASTPTRSTAEITSAMTVLPMLLLSEAYTRERRRRFATW